METTIREIKYLNDDQRLKELKNLLINNDIRVSHQRLLILNYLVSHDNSHPTAEKIFSDVKQIDPIISQATVYNTLNLFTEKKIIKELDFNMNSKRYEFAKEVHGHFICESCGLIEDFHVDTYELPEDLANCKINSQEIIYHGLCPDCK